MKKTNPQDLIGKKINRFIVESFSHDLGSGKNRYFYNCRCTCGNIKKVERYSLLKNKVKSCGCLKTETNKLRALHGIEIAFRKVIRYYKNNAKNKNKKLCLTPEEMLSLMTKNCHYCNGPPSNISKSNTINGENFIYNGIDRKNNELNYTLENCVTCCSTCNFMKQDMEYDTFLTHIFRITSNINNSSAIMKIGETIEKLQIANMKLFELCNKKDEAAKNPDKYTKEELTDMARKDIELCKERASCKSEINRIMYGNKSYEEVKNYGS